MPTKVKATQSADSQGAPREMIGYQVFNRRIRLSTLWLWEWYYTALSRAEVKKIL